MAHSLSEIRILRFRQLITENLATLLWVSGAMLVLSGFGLLGYQVVAWLRYGYWESFSVLDLVMKGISHWALYSEGHPLNQFVTWLNYPQQWIGLHKIVRGTLEVPISLVAVIGGFALWLPFIEIADSLEDKHRETLLQSLGFTAPLIFEGKLKAGITLSKEFDEHKRQFKTSVRINEVKSHSVALNIQFESGLLGNEAIKSFLVEVPLKRYRIIHINTPSHDTDPTYIVTKDVLPTPQLYITLLAVDSAEDSRLVRFAIAERNDFGDRTDLT